ncbi:MAG: hypothetical protein K0S47_44 [Herbinix sp.]|jgi:hypothetical protein|nr:hypothetical protein [Herbinix sp.]
MARNGIVSKIKWMPLPRTEKAEALSNPYCGFYSIFRFYIENEIMQQDGIKIDDVTIDPSQQICLIEINLIHFNEIPLSETALHNVKQIFQHFTHMERQMIVRFVYDWEGKGVSSEPKDILIILNHMSQLSSLLKEYTKYIYILQGLFIGSWGEMHNSRYLSERHMTRLAKHLYKCSGEKTQIALRCPSYWRMVFKTYQPLDNATAFTDIQKARFSLFNDGMMASDTDFGTYGSISAKDSKVYSDKWLRQDELEFQNKLCKYVSNGGEVVNECSFNDVATAIDVLKEMRVSYLHCQYDEKVLGKWKASRSGVANVLWKDKTAYEYIEAHLGYRFTIEESNVTLVSDKSGNLKASMTISNTGFAPCYHKFEAKFVIRTASFSEAYEYDVDTDTRKWIPNEKVELEAFIPTAGWKQKNYILCFRIYDPQTQRPIQIANTFSAIDHTGAYSLGNFITYM